MVTALGYNNHHCCTFSHLLTSHWFTKECPLIPRKAAALRCCDKGPCQELLENLRTPHTGTPKFRCLSLKIPQVQLPFTKDMLTPPHPYKIKCQLILIYIILLTTLHNTKPDFCLLLPKLPGTLLQVDIVSALFVF